MAFSITSMEEFFFVAMALFVPQEKKFLQNAGHKAFKMKGYCEK
jgi:uncharacterized protein with von Willebrand factor type A (vWA) domain